MNALIIANGTLPPEKFIRALLSSADIVLCADGGANHARQLRIIPDIIIGDMDSITPSTKKYFHNIPRFKIDDQSSTDMEKTLELCRQLFVRNVDIIGATGTRADHTAGSLGCFKKYGTFLDLRMIDTEGFITRVKGKTSFKTTKGEKISLIPLERCTGVTTTNLLYPLTNGILELGIQEGISNEATGQRCSVSVKEGTLLLYRFHTHASLSR
jgi:thiamine pyrophosphokinase